uniref:histidine kinase n=1 Tax=Cyanothece sp. (strain PCC 7425 / ATCC 29141) TaxID=395961 RepID=B8HVV8_CYAP4
MTASESHPSSASASGTFSSQRSSLRHDLRTPINAILGYSEMLLEELSPEEDLEQILLNKINRAGQQLLEQVNQLVTPSSSAEVSQIRHSLRSPLTVVIGYTELLLEEMKAERQTDLERIRSASQQMLGLIEQIVLVETDPQVSQVTGVAATDVAPGSEVELGASGQASSEDLTGKILVVDDTLINRDLLSRRLERQGHTVKLSENGQQALQLLESQSFDLVLLDVIMPKMNGLELLRLMKDTPNWKDIPVIMISALDEVESAVRCIELGAEDYLTKPFNTILLKARIKACLEKKYLRDQERQYLHQVACLTEAAAAVEGAKFQPDSLAEVAQRQDALGQLARVFQHMAAEVYGREQRLQQQIQQLKIEIDQEKRVRQVAEITESGFFRDLQQRAALLRKKVNSDDG